MFEVHCTELISALAKRANSLAKKMLLRMTKKNQEENERFVDWLGMFGCT